MMHQVTDKKVSTDRSWNMGQMNDPTAYKNQPTITAIVPVGDLLSKRLDKGTNIEAAIINCLDPFL
jgi:hypothetical protein